MKPIEQAIYTLVETDREAGYHVVAKTSGVCDADIEELAVWEPSRDAMLSNDATAESFNFHPLPSGAYCISRSAPAGWERGGGLRVFTHCLIIAPEVLARFSNNPFSIIQVFTEDGLWRRPNMPYPPLEPIAISGGAAPVDQSLLQHLRIAPGPRDMGALVQEARSAICLALANTEQSAGIIAGLFSCLPSECRLDFSFSTGLKFSPWRPYRLVAISDDPAERLWVATYPNVTVFEFGKGDMARRTQPDGWSLLVERSMASNRIPFLASQISKRRFDLTLNDLPALGLQLLEGLECAEFDDGDMNATHLEPRHASPSDRKSHAAHRPFEKSSLLAAMPRPAVTADEPSNGIYPQDVLEKLEHLDDLVYEAISGETKSLEQLRTLWPGLVSDLGQEILSESREQYLRYALSIWDECTDANDGQKSAHALQAVEVLCMLFSNKD